MKDITDGLAHCCPSKTTVVEMGEAGIFPCSFTEHPAWANKRCLVNASTAYSPKNCSPLSGGRFHACGKGNVAQPASSAHQLITASSL